MSEFAVALPALLLFSVTLIAVFWFSHQISQLVQGCIFNLTGSLDLAVIGYFLLLLPGIVVHEGAHWIVAQLLGLRPGKFSVWPYRRGAYIQLGSVTTLSGGIWLDSLVGLAPLLIGTLLVGLFSRQLFSGDPLNQMIASGDLTGWLQAIGRTFSQSDALLWSYLIFAVANGMMPSAPDRQPVKPVLLYIGLAVVVYLLVGLPLGPVAAALATLTGPLMWVNSGLMITVLLDAAVLAVLLVLVMIMPRRSR